MQKNQEDKGKHLQSKIPNTTMKASSSVVVEPPCFSFFCDYKKEVLKQLHRKKDTLNLVVALHTPNVVAMDFPPLNLKKRRKCMSQDRCNCSRDNV